MTSRDPAPRPCCWRCGGAFVARRVRVESVLHTRAAADGGPYRTVRCADCGTENGVLESAAGRVLLHPLEGLSEPTMIDRIVPRQSRESARAAADWWTRHRDDVERFRAEPARNAPPRGRGPARAKRAAPRTEPSGRPEDRGARNRRRRSPAAAPPPGDTQAPPVGPTPFDERAPHDLLGLPADADRTAIRAAYRAALKLCHPDRVANLDPEIQALATAKSKALRRAYEALLAARRGSG